MSLCLSRLEPRVPISLHCPDPPRLTVHYNSYSQTSREAIPQFQEGVSEIRRESEKIIQKAVDSMRKRVDDKLKIQESKAAKLIADLDKFEKDY